MLRISLFAALIYFVHSCCPIGFDLVRNGECYRPALVGGSVFVSEAAMYAKSICARHSNPPVYGTPVIIKNQEDHDYWVGVARESKTIYAKRGNIMLGLECNAKNHWQWMDGNAITFKPQNYNQALDQECSDGCIWTIDLDNNNWAEHCGGNAFVDFYCEFVQPHNIAPDAECADFSVDAEDNLCYQIGMNIENMTEAISICHSFGAKLASVHNDREQNFLRRLAVSKGLVSDLMLGAKWTDEKNFEWVDGTAWDYQNFAPGFPQSGAGECVVMQTDGTPGKWMNVDCLAKHPFACVRSTDDAEPACDGTPRAEGDIIYSPGFPATASQPCDFLLRVDPGMLVEVNILSLEANGCCDYLVLYEGSLEGNVIANLTGDSYDMWRFRTVADNSMIASWRPNGGVNVRGMEITFSAVPKV